MEHLIKKIADISKRENCIITLDIGPDNTLTIMIIESSTLIGLRKVYWIQLET